MNKTDMLFVRACKSAEPEKRIRSVYRRFYYSTKDLNIVRNDITNILARICDNYLDITASMAIDALRPNRYLWNTLNLDQPSFEERAFAVVVGWIRLSPVEAFKGYVAPAKFRNVSE